MSNKDYVTFNQMIAALFVWEITSRIWEVLLT